MDQERALSHVDEHGSARMVDITGKSPTLRRAVARCVVRASADAIGLLSSAGRILDAELAGVQAAKQTAALVPLCHPIRLNDVRVDVVPGRDRVDVSATAEVFERTGVEMEALTACAFAALSVVGFLLEADREAHVEDLALWIKTGGRSGTWERSVPEAR